MVTSDTCNSWLRYWTETVLCLSKAVKILCRLSSANISTPLKPSLYFHSITLAFILFHIPSIVKKFFSYFFLCASSACCFKLLQNKTTGLNAEWLFALNGRADRI